MFSPIGKKALIVELKRHPERKEEILERAKNSKRTSTPPLNSARSQSSSPQRRSESSSSPSRRPRTPLVESVGAGNSSTRNLEFIVQEDSMAGAVARKITDVAIRFRRERDGVALKVFETNKLSYEEFRDHLKRSFRLVFTDAEFEACCKIFDNDNDRNIDGSEFLVCFTKLAAIHKARQAQKIREQQHEFEERQRLLAEEKEAELKKKNELSVDMDFSEETKYRAIAKMTEAAKKYDRNHPASISLDGFEGASLAPAMFKEMLKRTFGLKLTPTELGALISVFDKDGDGRIDTAEFLLTFFKHGFAAREQEIQEQREKQHRLNAQAEQEKAKKQKELEDKIEMKLDYDFSEADEARMHVKLKEAAKKYDKNHPASVSLEGFDAKILKPGVFREMVKRTFNLHLTGKELGAAVKTFDKTGDGTINCRDFLVYFFQVGHAERDKDRKEQLSRQRALNAEAEAERRKKLKDAEEKTMHQIVNDFDPEDRESALQKIEAAATKYNKTHPSAMGLEGFDGSYVGPGVFKEMLKRTFNVVLTAEELAALMHEFPYEGDNKKVSCADFLKRFFKMGFEVRSERRRALLEEQREAEQLRREEEKAKKKALESKHKAECDYNYSEEDKKRILERLTEAAIKYDKNHASAVSLVGFQGAFMKPYVFKDMIFRTFNIKTSPKELGALMDHFDRDKNGEIDCSEFTTEFFRLGFERRAEIHRKQLEKQRQQNEQRQKEAIMKLREQEDKMKLKVDWDFKDEDLATVKKKITDAAMKYDKHHPASVGLDGFDSAYLSPGAFREIVKRTFRINLSARELAAMLTMFDADREGNIKSDEFLTKFMRIGLDAKYEFKSAVIEKQRKAAKEAKKEAEKKLAALWQKVEDSVDVDWDFSEEDEQSVLVKLVDAAAKYDKTAVSAPSLDGFSCVYLAPGAFKEMLKRTFNFVVAGKELGALISRFQHPQKPRHVDCQMFIINFLSLGFKERRKAKIAQQNLQKQQEKEAREESQRKIAELEKKNDIEVDKNFTAMEKRQALDKMVKAAFKYDPKATGAVSLRAFDAEYLTPSVFKETLKRTFNLHLDLREFGAIMQKFDPKDTGQVHCKTFLNEFLRTGQEERDKARIAQIEKNRLGMKLQKQEKVRKLKEAEAKMEKKVVFDFTPEEQASAFKKLTTAATKYHKSHPSAVGLDGFDALKLSFGEFKELLKRTFHLSLSEGELAAIIAFFDTEANGYIKSKDFLVYFFKTGFHERNKFHSEQLRKDREMNAQRKREEEEKLRAQWAKMELEVDWNFTNSDTESALAKVTAAARDYDPNHPSAMSLSAFDGASMTPAVFREMLKRVLNIHLTDRELGALIKNFDKDGDNKIDCAEFMVKFTSLGFKEKDRIRSKHREKTAKYTKRVREEMKAKEIEKEKKREAYVNWDFTNDDFNSALDKLKLAAGNYDRHHPSSVSLAGFQGASLTPANFREMLKRTFGIKLSPGELGAAVKFFDSDGDGTIDNAEFLKHFFKLQRMERSSVRRNRIIAERNVRKAQEEEANERARAKATEESIKLAFTKEDELSLMTKIMKISEDFATDSSSFVEPMQAFKGPALPPIAFKEVFYRIFLTRLTYPEIGALMSVLDEQGTGCIDGSKFLKSFLRLGRIQEKVLLGEMEANIFELSALKPSTTTGSDKLIEDIPTKKRALKPRPIEDLRNTSIQTTEEDIKRFTDSTVGQQWVFPNVVTDGSSKKGKQKKQKSRKKQDSPEKPKVYDESGIEEASYDDFEPVVLAPRPVSREESKSEPQFSMPPKGPPENAGTRKRHSPVKLVGSSKSPQEKAKLKIKFEEITLKKTNQWSKETPDRRGHLGRAGGDGGNQASPKSQHRPPTKPSKGKKKKPSTAPAPSGSPFFFPSLLATAPTLSLAPVGQDLATEENILLYERTDLL